MAVITKQAAEQRNAVLVGRPRHGCGEKSGIYTYTTRICTPSDQKLCNGVGQLGVQIPPWAFDTYHRGVSHRGAERTNLGN